VRPILNPGVRCVWRDHETLQLGLDPDRAVVLSGVDPGLAAIVERLTGTHTLDAIATYGLTRGVDDHTTRTFVRMLTETGLLDDADRAQPSLRALPPHERERLRPDTAATTPTALERRRAATVVVHGAGRVGASVATLLAAAGIGKVRAVDEARATPADLAPAGLRQQDLGGAKGAGVSRAIRAVAPSTETSAVEIGSTRPDLVVVAPDEEADRQLGQVLVRHGIPHLYARVYEAKGVLGPFVLPGRTSCQRCHDLHRADRDPAWPRLLAQVLADGPAVRACDVTLATTTAGLAALHVLAFLDGEPAPSQDGTIELALPFAHPRRRSWTPHPRCGCQWEHLESAA
jgi:hypothetical protein